MAQLSGLQGLGGPINYYESMVPDFRREALLETQNRLGQQQVAGQQVQNQQAQQENQRRQEFYGAIQNATPDQLPALRRQFPEFAQNIQQEIGVQGEEHAAFANKAMGNLSIALSSGDPNQIAQAIQSGEPVWNSMQTTGRDIMQLIQSDPQQARNMLKSAYMATLPYDKQADIAQNQQKIDETIRSNRAGESLQGQQIAVSRENSIRSASSGAGNSTPSSVREYQYFQSLSPEQQKTYMRVRGRPDAGGGDNSVQLSDGRTVNVSGKLHGSGANAFYEGTDNAGNMVRVPASAIAAPATSAATAQNYAMKKDIDAIDSASPDSLNFMTGVTGGNGTPALGADVRSRLSGKDQRQLYNATQRIQGRMQNQGIAAARDMGASGINTVAEAKMYFQGMPQLDYSSPESAQESVRNIREYTDNYNQQYNVDVGKSPNGGQKQTSQPAQQQQAGFSSLWGD
ncbi:DNA transfer protein [Yersinia enterocolitica]